MMNDVYCEYCQDTDLKDYIVNFLGDAFCSDECHELFKQFYEGEYEIVKIIKDNKEVNNNA